MSEFDQHQMTRLEFLRGVAALTGSLLIPQSFYKESNGAAVSERFSPNPSWVQDFSKMADGQPDPEYWNYVLGNTVPGYNNEAETLTNRPSNIRIQNGLLVIEARVQEDNDRQYTSAEIDTQGKFGFEYGKLEVNLKLPEGIGTWPAAWLLPTKPKYNPLKYGLTVPNGNWRINGEIDFAEAIGAMPGYVYPSVHTSSNFGKTNNDPVHLDIPNDTTAFHTYGVEKLPDSIVFT
ncbi:MAG TPA: glycoside hydrolase family 16 protein, partial [Candidatus Binatia bacterium]|nr:glycoside hydrolase family 16 protein [Candidatus Binatia bacterium]